MKNKQRPIKFKPQAQNNQRPTFYLVYTADLADF